MEKNEKLIPPQLPLKPDFFPGFGPPFTFRCVAFLPVVALILDMGVYDSLTFEILYPLTAYVLAGNQGFVYVV